MDETIEDLKKLRRSKSLAEETDLGLMDPEELKAKQDSLNQAFESCAKTSINWRKTTSNSKTPTP